jgi:hypothetical protein
MKKSQMKAKNDEYSKKREIEIGKKQPINCFPLSDKISSGVPKSPKNPSRASIVEAEVSVWSRATHGYLLYSSTNSR